MNRYYVKQQHAIDKRRWIVVAECYYRAHAKKIFEDCEQRWPDKKFRSNHEKFL